MIALATPIPVPEILSVVSEQVKLFRRNRDTEQRTLSAQSGSAAAPLMLAPTSSGATVTAETAMRVADAYACVRALSDAAASLPVHIYRHLPQGGRQRVNNRTAELLRRPGPGQTQSSLIGTIVAHLNLFGNCFIGKARTKGEITQLFCLPPNLIEVELVNGEPRFTFHRPDSAPTKHGLADIIHIKALSTDGVVGLSPVRQAREAIGLNAQLVAHAARFFQNDARPSGVLQVGTQGAAAQDQLEALKEAWNAHHGGGPANAHRIAILSGDVNFQPLSMPPEDAQFLEQRQLSAQEICRVFRVPPWVVGAPTGDSLTYATVEQQGLAFVTYSLRPWLTTMEQALSADEDLFPAGTNTYGEFLVDALLRSDSEARARVYSAGLAGGWLTVEECRERENLPPLPREQHPRPATRPTSTNGAKPQPVGAE
jgi:HK97 family phage portal protein